VFQRFSKTNYNLISFQPFNRSVNYKMPARKGMDSLVEPGEIIKLPQNPPTNLFILNKLKLTKKRRLEQRICHEPKKPILGLGTSSTSIFVQNFQLYTIREHIELVYKHRCVLTFKYKYLIIIYNIDICSKYLYVHE